MPRLDIPALRDVLVDSKGVATHIWQRWFQLAYEVITRSQFKEVIYGDDGNGDLADQVFFIANRAYEVVAIQQIHATKGSDGSAVNLQVTKDTGTNAPGAGTNLLTNNSNAGFNLKATNNTVQEGDLATTVGLMKMSKGDRLAVDFAGTLTSVAGLQITVSLKAL